MAYTPLGLKDGEKVYASHVTHVEDGIADCESQITEVKDSLSDFPNFYTLDSSGKSATFNIKANNSNAWVLVISSGNDSIDNGGVIYLAGSGYEIIGGGSRTTAERLSTSSWTITFGSAYQKAMAISNRFLEISYGE